MPGLTHIHRITYIHIYTVVNIYGTTPKEWLSKGP